jgi:hypothetical protein
LAAAAGAARRSSSMGTGTRRGGLAEADPRSVATP